MKEQTIAQKALNKIRSIKHSRFIQRDFTNNIDSCCFIGHINRLERNPKDYSIDNCAKVSDFTLKVMKSSTKFIKETYDSNYAILTINDRPIFNYNQNNSKDRIIALLKDMIKAGY